MPESVKVLLHHLKDSKELVTLAAAIIGLIAAVIGRKRVVIHIQKTESIPLAETGPHGDRDRRLQLHHAIKRALGYLIGCLLGLIVSLVAFWYFATETAAYVEAHGPVTPHWQQRWGQGEGLFVLLLLSYVGLGAWAIGCASQLARTVYLSWQLWRLRRKGKKARGDSLTCLPPPPARRGERAPDA
jgi:hypothetical protein